MIVSFQRTFTYSEQGFCMFILFFCRFDNDRVVWGNHVSFSACLFGWVGGCRCVSDLLTTLGAGDHCRRRVGIICTGMNLFLYFFDRLNDKS